LRADNCGNGARTDKLRGRDSFPDADQIRRQRTPRRTIAGRRMALKPYLRSVLT